MQENNFEKQVQQKMDELSIKPSEELWQKVSIAIAKRKTDRRIFVIIFLLLLLISSGVFITWNQMVDGRTNKAIVEIAGAGKTNATIQPGDDKNLLQNNDSRLIEKEEAGVSPIDQQEIAAVTKSPETSALMTGNESNGNNIVDTKSAEEIDIKKSVGAGYNSSPRVDVMIVNSDVETISEISPVLADTQKINIEKIIAYNEQVEKETVGILLGKIECLGSIQKPKKRWELGFNFSAGGVAMQNGVLGVIGLGNADESKSYAAYSPVTGGSNGSATSPAATPSAIEPGFGIVLGAFLQKNISSNMNLLFGLNYKRYSSSMMVGARVDSSFLSNMNNSSTSYRPGNSTAYKNNFHFLELPVALQFRVTKKQKLPVYIYSGLSIAQLIGSNALQFSAQPGSYYSDNDLFNKTQVNVSAGILFSLSRRAKNPFLLGPDINFSLSEMANSGLYKDRHYSYLGIVLQKRIGKN